MKFTQALNSMFPRWSPVASCAYVIHFNCDRRWMAKRKRICDILNRWTLKRQAERYGEKKSSETIFSMRSIKKMLNTVKTLLLLVRAVRLDFLSALCFLVYCSDSFSSFTFPFFSFSLHLSLSFFSPSLFLSPDVLSLSLTLSLSRLSASAFFNIVLFLIF